MAEQVLDDQFGAVVVCCLGTFWVRDAKIYSDVRSVRPQIVHYEVVYLLVRNVPFHLEIPLG